MENGTLTGPEREAVHGAMHRLERRWNVLPIPNDPQWHAYEALPFWDFLAAIRRASELTDGRTFLDVGCGIGTKLAIMYSLGWTVTGIDHHLPYVEAARELVPEATVEHGEILEQTTFQSDLVYLYRPARPLDLEIELEQYVLDRVSPGTVCFFPLRHDPEVWVA